MGIISLFTLKYVNLSLLRVFCFSWKVEKKSKVLSFFSLSRIVWLIFWCFSFQKSESGPRQIKVRGKYNDGTPFEDIFNTVVFAIGRDADTSSLGLSEAGVKVNPKNGKIIDNDKEQSSSSNVYAIGDVIDGGLELTPVAIQVRRNFYWE